MFIVVCAAIGALCWLGHPWVWRYLSGQPLDGRRRTDGSFVHPGTRSLTPGVVRFSRWSGYPGWQRAGIRVSTLALAALALDGWITHPTLTRNLALLSAWATGSAATWRGYQRWRDRRHWFHTVLPLHLALAAYLALPASARPRDYLRVPVNYARSHDARTTITLPPTWTGNPGVRKELATLVMEKLELSSSDAEWDLEMKRSPTLTIKLSHKPPKTVSWSDELATLAACRPGQLFIGRDKLGHAFYWDLAVGEDPHAGFSIHTGLGKSTLMMALTAQLLHQDHRASVTYIDPKMVSADALAGVPGLTLVNDPRNVGAMWEAIEGSLALMDERRDALAADPTATFARHMLILDEVNMFATMSRSHWLKVKPKGAPATPAIWDVIAALIWQGRQFGVHLVLLGQRLDERATGGIGLRDSLGFRGLAGFRANQWLMLVGTVPIPRAQKGKGRWIYDDGESSTWVQNVYPSAQDLRSWALDRQVAPTPNLETLAGTEAGTGVGSPVVTVTVLSDVKGPTSSLPAETPELPTPPVAATAWIIGREAGAAHLHISLAAFDKRRERRPIPGETRRRNQPAWTEADLDAWSTVTEEISA